MRAKINHNYLECRFSKSRLGNMTYECLTKGNGRTIGGNHLSNTTRGSFLVRRTRRHPGVVLPLVISNSANH